MHIKNVVIVFLAVALLCSCGVAQKNIVYFQDLKEGSPEFIVEQQYIRLQPDDKISIIVNSKDPKLTALFNLAVANRTIGTTDSASGSSASQVASYTIDSNGNIDFPVLGTVHVAGMTRTEIRELIKNRLISENLVNDAIVTVEYANLTISVLGEVSSPGKYSIDKDNMTILDALSMAGDLTINGLRNSIYVLRNEDGRQVSYTVDLLSARELYSSPVYFVRQNDVIYVEPNAMKARQSTVNGNALRSVSFWTSIVSFLASISSIIISVANSN
ncbi:MAG: polysaccharide export protein [Bacteroidales bacterium]|nr:polysaccharide export protein [Bacteroides sp.]MCM1198890.1 polysaccharide export protein [Clostridium sp.]MCM1501098.1 polysaccharide export protein [Bacteroidales bacterium]